jgi:ABC-2 type transport system ATP-binding protein
MHEAREADGMIEIEGLGKRFGAVMAVDGLSLSIPRGELFCFLGPNGAGKTTTIKMLTGLVRPDAGRIRLGGIDPAADPVAAKRLMGYIPDMPYLYDRLTPLEFIEFVGDLYGAGPDRVRAATGELLEQFDLEPYRGALIGELSHGLRQRLIYVATLMHEPRVLFVDEPLVGLDPYTIRMIKDLLRARTRAGMTIFLTTHILAVAEQIADRVGIISRGRLVAVGGLDELLAGKTRSLEDFFLELTRADRGATRETTACD